MVPLRTFQSTSLKIPRPGLPHLLAGCGWWVVNQTFQHLPEEGSTVSGCVSWTSSLLASIFCILGKAGVQPAQLGEQNCPSPTLSSQTVSASLSNPAVGLGPHLSPCPDNVQPEVLTSQGGDTAHLHQSPSSLCPDE